MPKSIARVSFAANDDELYRTIHIDSRDLINVERKYRDVVASRIFTELTFTNLYRLVYVAAVRRKLVPEGITLPDFTEAYLVRAMHGDELEEQDTDGSEELDGEPDPTSSDR